MTLSSTWHEDEAALVLRWTIPNYGLPRLVTLRQMVAKALPDIDAETLIDLKLIATELVTNVYEHARTWGEIRILRPAEGVMCVEVDDGVPHPPAVVVKPGRVRCRGWDIVNALAKQWGVRRNDYGKTVWVEVDAHG